MTNGPLKVGIGGPVGAGKTSLTEALCRTLAGRCSMAVITNDIYTREDAEYLMRTVLPVLYQGMRVVDLERPNAPLEYLALYLLKN